jgi:hypothetical protein
MLLKVTENLNPKSPVLRERDLTIVSMAFPHCGRRFWFGFLDFTQYRTLCYLTIRGHNRGRRR